MVSRSTSRQCQARLSKGKRSSTVVLRHKFVAEANFATLNSALKIRMHKMFFDTAFNALPTVLTNLYHTFHESALRCYGYLKSLPPRRQPPPKLLISKLTRSCTTCIAISKSAP